MKNFLKLSSILILATACYNPPPEGQRLYDFHCAACHGQQGEGLKSLYPALAGTDYLAENWDQLSCIIVNGIDGPILVNGREYNQKMYGVEGLSESDIANIINYISRNIMETPRAFVSPGVVSESLKSCNPERD